MKPNRPWLPVRPCARTLGTAPVPRPAWNKVTSAPGIGTSPVRTTPHCVTTFAGVNTVVADEVPAASR